MRRLFRGDLTKLKKRPEGPSGGAAERGNSRRVPLTKSTVSKVIDRDAVVEHLLGLLDDIQDGITRLNDLAVSVPSEAPVAVWHELNDDAPEE